ncbi:hypothetical protein B0H10DRAFT_1950721 [Mycena sp. CBHHK59/15]|nr:hypothetical protein B0H10DRAFT_1950721 [Mycena sp. CBHHK59/15]
MYRAHSSTAIPPAQAGSKPGICCDSLEARIPRADADVGYTCGIPASALALARVERRPQRSQSRAAVHVAQAHARVDRVHACREHLVGVRACASESGGGGGGARDGALAAGHDGEDGEHVTSLLARPAVKPQHRRMCCAHVPKYAKAQEGSGGVCGVHEACNTLEAHVPALQADCDKRTRSAMWMRMWTRISGGGVGGVLPRWASGNPGTAQEEGGGTTCKTVPTSMLTV